ncbi:MAG: hypothetical protein QW041_02510 [Candidatus Pacearchaeota archaeon]
MAKPEQEYIANNQNSLVLLTKDEKGARDLVGHIRYSDDIKFPVKSWFPYKIKEKLDFSSDACLGIVKYSIDDIIKDLADGKELPFVLVEGDFPRGCGLTVYSPRLIIAEKRKSKDDIIRDIEEIMPYNAMLKYIADGKLRLKKGEGLHVNDFSTSYFENQSDYLDTIAAIAESYLAKEETTILFHAKLR